MKLFLFALVSILCVASTFAAPLYVATPTLPGGLIESGNIDLLSRPNVANADGTHSSVFSMSVESDGIIILLPRVVGDKVVSEDEAWQHYLVSGEHLGKFDNEENATRYAESLHEQQERLEQ